MYWLRPPFTRLVFVDSVNVIFEWYSNFWSRFVHCILSKRRVDEEEIKRLISNTTLSIRAPSQDPLSQTSAPKPASYHSSFACPLWFIFIFFFRYLAYIIVFFSLFTNHHHVVTPESLSSPCLLNWLSAFHWSHWPSKVCSIACPNRTAISFIQVYHQPERKQTLCDIFPALPYHFCVCGVGDVQPVP